MLVSGGIDISFTASRLGAQYFAAMVATQYGMPAVPAMALVALLGIGLGASTRLLIHYLRVVSIIVTIATSSIYYALLIYFTDVRDLRPAGLVGDRVVFFRSETASGDVVKIRLPIVVMAWSWSSRTI